MPRGAPIEPAPTVTITAGTSGWRRRISAHTASIAATSCDAGVPASVVLMRPTQRHRGIVRAAHDATATGSASAAGSSATAATASSMRRERRSISAAVPSIVAVGVRSLQPAR